MRYFKSLGISALDFSKISAESLARASGVTVKVLQAEGITQMMQIKANWPKVTRTYSVKRDGVPMGEPRTVTMYVWKFANGKTSYTIEWNNELYLHVKNGTWPARRLYIPDLSKVTLGSREYFRFLCRAQGKGGADPTVQGIRVAFDKRGWTWQATTDLRMRSLSPPYASRQHPSIPRDQIDVCSSFVSNPKTTNEMTWAARAYNYSTDKVEGFKAGVIEMKQRRADISSECAMRVPPDQVAACEAFLGGARGRGRTIEDFLQKLIDDEGRLPGGIPKMYLVAGAVGVVVLGAVLLKGRK